MSTLLHNPPAANVESPASVAPTTTWNVDAAVRHFVATADGLGAPRPASDELLEMVHQVAAFTRDLFPGKMIVETGVDPEIREDVCFLVHVEADGAVGEILALEDAWVRRAAPILRQWPGLFCLMVDVR